MMETINSPTVFEPSFRSSSSDVSRLKNSMKLDFSPAAASTSKTKKAAQANCAALLASPDLAMLKMASPELEKMIMAQQQNFSGSGTTPTPTQFIFPKNVTEEQEQYAKGFIQALEQLHRNGQMAASGGATGSSTTLVTVVDSAKAGPLPSADSGYNLTTLSSAGSSSGSSNSSGASSVHSFNLSPPHHLAAPSSSAAQTHPQQHHSLGLPRPVDLTQSHASVPHVQLHAAAAPAATLVTSLPGSNRSLPGSIYSQSGTNHSLSVANHSLASQFAAYSIASSTQPAGVVVGARHPNAATVVVVNNNKTEPTTTASMIPQPVFAHDRVFQLKGDPDVTSSSPCSSPPVSPINMEAQERIKLERKRARNRLAATKCRKRKLDRIAHLEGRVSDLKETNVDLGKAAQELRHQVSELKKQIMQHCKSGCSMPFFGEDSL